VHEIPVLEATMEFLNIAVILVVVLQVATGFAKASAARKAAEAAANNADILADIAVGKNTITFDKTDILAVALAVFVFWSVGSDSLPAREGLSAFIAVLAGTGVKELIEVWYPTRT
jgi:chromate transport protein ChrA